MENLLNQNNSVIIKTKGRLKKMFDYSNRPRGMSRREYWSQQTGRNKSEYKKLSKRESWSQQTGNPKENYVRDINKSTGSFNAPNASQQFVDTSRIDKAYGQAKDTYLQELKALTPRYESLYNQLEEEKKLALEKEGVLSAEEQAQQKRNIAKRGIAVDTSNQFYTDEKGKLAKQQLLRSKETALDFAGRRGEIATAESADKRDFTTAIANLDLNKANTIESMIDSAKKMSASQRQQDIENAMWQKTFSYNKSKDEADRALQLYKLAKSEASRGRSSDDKYNTALSSLVATAYSTPNPAPYTRETIQKTLEAKFPDSASKVKSDINKFFPDGWEGQTPKQTTNDTAERELLDDIDKGASLSDLLKAYPDVPVETIKKYYNG